MRITKVYTRTGDKGTTGLADGTRVPKNSLRLECYGTLDELNSVVGMVRQSLGELQQTEAEKLDKWCEAIQNDLFNLGGDLATPVAGRWPQMIVINQNDVSQLEKLIDYCQETLEPLREFVLPGGTKLNAELHLCRTICRRAERLCVTLQEQQEINPSAVPYINRLSDLFFVLSRWVQKHANKAEVTWSKVSGIRSLTF